MITRDGVTLATRRFDPDGVARVGVVLMHGFSAGKDDPAVVAVGEALAAHGASVLAFDARGHGASEGLCTLGDMERFDVAAAVAELSREHRDVVLVGASMGAISVLRYAAGSDTPLAGVIAISSPAHWKLPLRPTAVVAAGLTRTRPGRWLAQRHLRVRLHPRWDDPLAPSELVAAIDAPLAIIHGSRDLIIPASSAAALYKAAGADAPRKVTVVPGAGHAYDTRITPAILQSLDWALAARATAS